MSVMRDAVAPAHLNNTTLWLWVLAFARTTPLCGATLCGATAILRNRPPCDPLFSRNAQVGYATPGPPAERIPMNGSRYHGVRVEGAKYGVGFGSALAIAISYTNNHSILWAIIHGILGWLYVIYAALFG